LNASVPIRLIAALLSAVSVATAHAQSTLTLDQAQRVAVERSRRLQRKTPPSPHRGKWRAPRVGCQTLSPPSASTTCRSTDSIDTIHLDPVTLDTDLQHHPDLAVLATNEDVAAADVRVAESREESRCGRRGPDRSDHPGNFRNASPEDA
jgi:hypothetical protein